jgi:hypothetical protein
MTTGGNSVRAFRVVLSGSEAAFGTLAAQTENISVPASWILTGKELIEPASLHPVYSLLDLSVNRKYGYGVVLQFTLQFQNTTTLQILQDR